MQKRDRRHSDKVTERRNKEGRGRGDGPDYKPWIITQDAAVMSRVSRVRSTKCGRVLHLLSDLEVSAAWDFEWNPAVRQVKEQFPLDLEVTRRIAREMKVPHPAAGRNSDPVVMTTDLVLEVDTATGPMLFARAVKALAAIQPSLDADEPKLRTIAWTVAKLEIERRYWDEQGVDWQLITEVDLNRARRENIESLLNLPELDPERRLEFWRDALGHVAQAIRDGGSLTLSTLAREAERSAAMRASDFMTCVRFLARERRLVFDMNVRLDGERRACDFEFLALEEAVRAAA